MKKLLTLALLLSGILVFLPAVAYAGTLYVDDDSLCGGNVPCYSDIQSAINASIAGDTVYVYEGMYPENIRLKSGVVVQGSGADVTTIQGTGSGSVVTAKKVDSSTKIDGFTITGGYAHNNGGGIYCLQSSLTISNNIISDNYAVNYGGGIYSNDSSPTISNNTISDNDAYFYGGGIYSDASSLTISNNNISNNSTSWHGGGMYLRNSFSTISNNIISKNLTFRDGGGILLYNSSSTILNNTISDNYARYGAGIMCSNNSSPTILNNIISNNSATAIRGGIACWYSSFPTIDYNNVWGNTPPQYYAHQYYGCTAGAHDITDYPPMFENPAIGDYHLQDGSPCIDAGSNDYAAWPTDLDGNIRVVDGPPVDGYATVDMGALENTSLVEQFTVDIKPGTDMNCINPEKNGVTPVAILGSADLDVSNIDLTSIEIDDDGDSITEGVSPCKSKIKDVNGDGIPDLMVHFDTPTMNIEGILDNDGARLFITGNNLVSGMAIFGFDVIHLTTGPGCSK